MQNRVIRFALVFHSDYSTICMTTTSTSTILLLLLLADINVNSIFHSNRNAKLSDKNNNLTKQ